jgi:hypothetical protein
MKLIINNTFSTMNTFQLAKSAFLQNKHLFENLAGNTFE